LKILLASPVITSEFDSGIYILRALSELGHHVRVWDYRLSPYFPPTFGDYDLLLANKGETVPVWRFKPPRVCWYPDVLGRFPEHLRVIREYDLVFTINKPPEGCDWATWLPGCYDPLVHQDLRLPREWDTIYIGTANSKRKVEWIRAIRPQVIFGNGWQRFGIEAHPPQYSVRFAAVVNRARIAINVHESEHGVNRKLYELVPCAFTLTDRVRGIEEILGDRLADLVCFDSPRRARELIQYYLENPEERERVWAMERKLLEPYTYENQVRKILEAVG